MNGSSLDQAMNKADSLYNHMVFRDAVFSHRCVVMDARQCPDEGEENAALTDCCTCSCMWGGVIKIKNYGNTAMTTMK
jgi:hypothetical protein